MKYTLVLHDYFTEEHNNAMRKLLHDLRSIEVDEVTSTDMEIHATATTEDAEIILSALEDVECFSIRR